MRRLAAVLLLAASVACAHPRPAPAVPEFAPLPAVRFTPGPDGSVCLSKDEAKKLAQRERLRDIREETYKAMLWGNGGAK